MNERLQEILNTMDVPEQRRSDFRWLLRNMFIRNGDHEDFEEAEALVKKLIKLKQ